MDLSQGAAYYYNRILCAYEYFVTFHFWPLLQIPFDLFTPPRCILNYLGFQSVYYYRTFVACLRSCSYKQECPH